MTKLTKRALVALIAASMLVAAAPAGAAPKVQPLCQNPPPACGG